MRPILVESGYPMPRDPEASSDTPRPDSVSQSSAQRHRVARRNCPQQAIKKTVSSPDASVPTNRDISIGVRCIGVWYSYDRWTAVSDVRLAGRALYVSITGIIYAFHRAVDSDKIQTAFVSLEAAWKELS